MKSKQLIVILLAVFLCVSGCGKGTACDIDNVLENQKIVFIMSVSSYDEIYAAGYFIDTAGKKHIYKLYNRWPFETIEKEYAYLLKHYDEFETVDFFDDKTLRKCTKDLYQVNSDSELTTEGMGIIDDYPLKQLYGVRMIDGQEEFVFLGSDTGILTKLDNPAADRIFGALGGNRLYELR